MIIENEFTVPVHPDRALDLLTDVPRIAPCVPGVTLTEARPDRSYDGTASVRLGPVALTFDGTARIEEIDEAAQTARVSAEGKDKKGRGRATADVTFKITPDGEASRVSVTTDLALTGTVAQYGRASGLITEVANQIIADFVRNLEAELQSGGDTAAAPPAATNETATADADASGKTAGGAAAGGAAAGTAAGGRAASGAGAAAAQSGERTASAGTQRPPPQPRPASQLSGFLILRRALFSWLRKLFARK
jgi:carbon monoxide dehydrogenase subunit G